jgi:polysaccharide export outer membrane protein
MASGMHRRTFLVLVPAALAGCSTAPRRRPQAFADVLDQPYRLDSGDKLRITVFEQASLTNTYSVDQSGHVTMPLIGPVPARGATTQELAGRIAGSLRQGFLRNPDVSVEVDTYRPFFIMGEVRNPGQYTYVNGLTAQTAIAIAGGYTARASEGTVEITRTINGEVITGRVPATDPVRPGDVIRVAQRLL